MDNRNYEVIGEDGLSYDRNGFRTSHLGKTGYLGVQRMSDGRYFAAPACHDYDFDNMGFRNYMPPIHISSNILECAMVATRFYEDKNGNLKDLYKTKDKWGRYNVDLSLVKEAKYAPIDPALVCAPVKTRVARKTNVRRAGSGRPGPVATPRDIANTQVRGYASYMVDKHRLPANVKGLVMKIVNDRDFETYEIGTAFVNGVIANATRR